MYMDQTEQDLIITSLRKQKGDMCEECAQFKFDFYQIELPDLSLCVCSSCYTQPESKFIRQITDRLYDNYLLSLNKNK